MNALTPWRRRKTAAPARQGGAEEHPFALLHRQMDDLFERFFRDWDDPFGVPAPALGAGTEGTMMPSVDVAETDDELQVTADLPGMSEKDVEVSVDDQVLTLRGEKRMDREEKKKNWHVIERAYGSFHRSIPLPSGLDESRIKAQFKNGVLTVRLPKTPEAKSRRRTIAIESD
jgi:HSP20 family protein